MLLLALAQFGKLLAALFVLFNPFLGESAVLNLLQHFLHRLARRISYHHFATGQVAVLGGVRYRIAHAAQAAFVDEVDDQFHLVHALEVGDLGSVAGLDQRLETFFHQRSQPAAEHRLFAEQIALGFFLKRRLQHARARRADAVRIAERVFMRVSAGILVDREQRGHTSALRIHAPQQMARTLGRDHDHVHIFWRLDGFEVNREAVRKAENLSLAEMRLDRRLVEVGLGFVGRENLNPVGALGGLGGSDDGHAIGDRLVGRTALGVKSDNNVVSAVPQVLRLRMSLRPVAENGNGLALERGRVGIILIKNCRHWKAP